MLLDMAIRLFIRMNVIVAGSRHNIDQVEKALTLGTCLQRQ
jgi:hypothetical protein